MKLFNININEYFNMIPLWKSPIKLPLWSYPLELPVERIALTQVQTTRPQSAPNTEQWTPGASLSAYDNICDFSYFLHTTLSET